jgi:hypothetical protein
MALTNVFTGAHGTISLAVEGTPAQQGDFTAINDAYTAGVIGRVTDVEVCVQTELQEYFQIGQREVVTLSTGNVHVSGKIGRAYINGALLFLLLDRGATQDGLPTIQPRFALNVQLVNPHIPNNRLQLNVSGVKFENWGVTLPQNTFVMEQVTFKAVHVTVLDVEDNNPVTVAFPAEGA